LVTVKDEREEAPPPRRRHGSGGVVIRGWRHPSHPCQLQLVKREWTPPPEYKVVVSIVKAKDDPEEFPGLRHTQLKSFQETDEFVEA
jgi:hypothetical protein